LPYVISNKEIFPYNNQVLEGIQKTEAITELSSYAWISVCLNHSNISSSKERDTSVCTSDNNLAFSRDGYYTEESH